MLAQGMPSSHHPMHGAESAASSLPTGGAVRDALTLLELTGLAGAILVALSTLVGRVRSSG